MLPVGFRHIIKFFSGGEDDITIFSQKLAVSRNIGISQLISELRASTCSAFAASEQYRLENSLGNRIGGC
ncbi:hypothetical protein H9L39_18643 [Fusarium oxysporum f. sp. albedinis]|nr:hypothetical protein H9L39_18643 [Fusarium oxysporum f. sp. albedinis]